MDDWDDEELGGLRLGDPVLVTLDSGVEAGVLVSTGLSGIVIRVTHRAVLKMDRVDSDEIERMYAAVAELGMLDLLDYAIKRHGVSVWDLVRLRSREALISEVVLRAVEEKEEASERVVLAAVLSPITKFVPLERIEEVVDYAEWAEDNALAMLDFTVDMSKVKGK